MSITINTYCRVNQNGSININTDPTFLQPPTPPNTNDYACVVVGYDEPGTNGGTYVVTGNSIVDGVTRPVYTNANGWTIQIINSGGVVWAFFDNGGLYAVSTTQPVPTYPWLATGYGFDILSFTAGQC